MTDGYSHFAALGIGQIDVLAVVVVVAVAADRGGDHRWTHRRDWFF